MTEQENICVHVNSRYVESTTIDLDVYDTATLCRAMQSLAGHAESWNKQGLPERAAPYTAFKGRIKRHLNLKRK